MGWFRRGPKEDVQSGPPPAEMRGRAAEISDPSVFGWEVIWEALKTEPPAEDPSTITQELGLDQESDVIRTQQGGVPATEFSGTRHGRHVALRMGVVPPGIRMKGYNEVQVTTSVAPFHLQEQNGQLVADSGGGPALDGVLAALAPAPKVWRQLEVEGSSEGILARRPVTAHSQGYVYDLWLVERLAEQLGS